MGPDASAAVDRLVELCKEQSDYNTFDGRHAFHLDVVRTLALIGYTSAVDPILEWFRHKAINPETDLQTGRRDTTTLTVDEDTDPECKKLIERIKCIKPTRDKYTRIIRRCVCPGDFYKVNEEGHLLGKDGKPLMDEDGKPVTKVKEGNLHLVCERVGGPKVGHVPDIQAGGDICQGACYQPQLDDVNDKVGRWIKKKRGCMGEFCYRSVTLTTVTVFDKDDNVIEGGEPIDVEKELLRLGCLKKGKKEGDPPIDPLKEARQKKWDAYVMKNDKDKDGFPDNFDKEKCRGWMPGELDILEAKKKEK